MVVFSKAQNKGLPYSPKARRWDIRLSHNNEKVGEINKDFSDNGWLDAKYTLHLMDTLIQEGVHNTIKTKRFYFSLGEAKGIARAILEDKELLISILTRQRENQIARSVNQAWGER